MIRITSECSELRNLDHSDAPVDLDRDAMPEFEAHTIQPPQKPKRPARKKSVKKSPIEKSLKAIYFGSGRDPADMTTLERANGSRKRHVLSLLVIFFALLALIAWVVFFMFAPGSRFSGNGVQVLVEGPEEVKIGEEVSYQIKYENQEKLALGRAELELILPKELTNVQYATPPTKGTTWELGSLGKGEAGMLELRGMVVGNISTPISLQAKFTYTPANINSEFERVARKIVRLTDSPIGLAVQGPERVGPGDVVTYRVTASGTSERSLGSSVVRIKLPERFITTLVTPALAEGASEWSLGELQLGAEQTITIQGSYASEAGGEATLEATAGVKYGQDFITLRKQVLTTHVAQGDMELSLVVNGKTNEAVAEPGEALHYNLRYRNRGNNLLGDVELSLVLHGATDSIPAPVDWSKVEDELKGKIEKDRVTWSKKQIRRLGGLKPNDEGTIDFSVPVLSDAAGGSLVVATVEARVGSVGERDEPMVIRTSPLGVTIGTEANLSVAARYYSDDNEALGTGPVPPKVGERTTFRILWKIQNTLHELGDVVVETKLPEGVEWTTKTEAAVGSLTYEVSSRRVIWGIDRLGTTTPGAAASFEVGITPTESDVGHELTLTDVASLSAKDSVTNQSLTRTASKTTTELTGDPEFEGKGVVVSN